MRNPFADSEAGHRKKKIFLGFCLLFIITILLHITFLENKFIDGEDLTHIVQNPLIRNIGMQGFFHDLKGYYFYQYPLFFLTYFWGMIFSVWELNHIGFHFISFLFHAICTGLLFLLLIRITGKTGSAFLAALFFGVHPLHCETVNWISRQDMMLTVLFGLFYLYLGMVRHLFTRILSILFLLVSVCISPVGILFLPAKFLLHSEPEDYLWKPLWAELILPLVVWLVVWIPKVSLVSPQNPLTVTPKAVFWLLRGMIMPWKVHFMLPVLAKGSPLLGIIPVILILGIFWLAIRIKHQAWGLIGIGLLSFYLLHLYSGRFNGGYAYPSLIMIALAIGIGGSRLKITTLPWKIGISSVLILVFGFWGWLAYSRNMAWRNTKYLLNDALTASPSDGWLLSMLGHYEASFLERKETDNIFQRVNQESPSILYLKARAYHLLLDTGKSFRLYNELFRKYPAMKDNKYCLFDYAVLHVQTGRPKTAKRLLRKIVASDPYFIYAWHDLGTLFLREKNGEKGIKFLQKVLEIAPAYRPTLENMAYYFTKKGMTEKAATYIVTALHSTSCHDTQRFYREWLKALKEKKPFKYASLQWADLKPPG